MAKQTSIYQGLAQALSGNGRKKDVDDKKVGLTKPQNPVETAQQEFLDWQVNTMSRDLYQRSVYTDTDRLAAYQDFRTMDNSPVVSAALSIIRDECLTRSEKGKILEIYSDDARVKEILIDLFKNVLNVDYNFRLWIRDLIKYGDYFIYLMTDKDVGIYNFQVMMPEEMTRYEGVSGKNDVTFRHQVTGQDFEGWQIAHLRLIEDTKKMPFGRSILESARKVWKQLQLAMDAMLVYRIERAPERRVFHIDVGNIPPEDIPQYMQKIQNQIKKQPVVNPANGQWNFKYNPLNVTEDFFIPIRGEHSSKIETLPGATNLDAVQDIEFLQSQLFAALQVPKAYLNFVDALPGGSTLSQADLRFSRTINTIQEAVLMEMRRIANVHLYILGFGDDMDNFTLGLTNPSTQQELLKLETTKSRMEVWEKMYTTDANCPVSYTWAMENILGFSKSEIKHILKQKKVEKKVFAEIDSALETYKKSGLFKDIDDKYEMANPPTSSGEGEEDGGGGSGGGGGGGGDSSITNMGGFSGGGPELGGEDSGEPMGGEEAPSPEAEPLSEIIYRKRKKIMEKRFDSMINELFSQEEIMDRRVTTDIGGTQKTSLLENNRKFNIETGKLIESISRTLKIEQKDEEELDL